MRATRSIGALFLLASLCVGAPAFSASSLEAVKILSAGDEITLELSLDAKPSYRVLRVNQPERLVVDLTDTVLGAPLTLPLDYRGNLIRNLRSAQYDPHTLRVVFDLSQAVPVLSQRWNNGLLTIRLKETGVASSLPAALPATGPGPKTATPLLKDRLFAVPPIPKPRPSQFEGKRPLLIAIDAGHGGQDPGAIGPDGSHEKNITFAIAKALQRELTASGRYKVYLTRGDDTFVLLRDRIVRARKVKADLFISIHADSAPGGEARGLSVYTLSETASDKEAAKLAAQENKVDILSGLDLEVDNKEVADILIDLVRRDTRNQSSDFADSVVGGMKESGVRLLPRPHRYAGFAVLKAPDIPSILVETGFISNAEEEKLLLSDPYRKRLARAILLGIDRYQAARSESNL